MTKHIRIWLSEKLERPNPVRRLSRAELEARAESIAREWLKVSRAEAFAKLDRGELSGTIAEPELRAIRDMLAA